MSVFIFATLQCQPETTAAVCAAMRDMQQASRQEPGCLQYQVLQATDQPHVLHVFEAYQDMAAVEAHRAAAHYLAYREWVADKLAAPVEIKLLQPLD
ncbi:putative quinol monooxygenase [Aquitalea aquatica]|uniref:Antibiotic biosynthesis monooxygenase n=1 Tax=Aquitalea aquatica TaxID=3044273 RepID=A0A838XZE9_9NEIS|nr:putative quinol monooxygenase [Aquitalea magnusonii]MBA4708570.1 antibiotic biosynthesis monooxygenase [Aquitalea magnusonii]